MARPRRILVLDDEPLLVRLLQRVLEANGCEVICAADGRQALAALDTAPVDLVISDVRMPAMDGPTFLAELRRRTAPPPLVFLTGYGDYTDAELLDMGAVEIHGKPIAVKALLDIVDRHARPGN